MGTRASTTMEFAHFFWNIPIPATEVDFKIVHLLSMCIRVRFNMHVLCTETFMLFVVANDKHPLTSYKLADI